MGKTSERSDKSAKIPARSDKNGKIPDTSDALPDIFMDVRGVFPSGIEQGRKGQAASALDTHGKLAACPP
ncbi:hypothetical protein ACM0P6_02940 [Komagataeibacter sucrofermentans]|uniref:hypothetical protein n=1 Tax=Komagataeibacter sucrofermentans TaxID=1053551 RepID=UPI00142D6C44|nr:hypothetical protein [Komagataeibacter sucrofermentans]GBQ52202.1 hypothetical protein AA15973_2693 [Komagataeibacter sucrofermentans DSM 15973]